MDSDGQVAAGVDQNLSSNFADSLEQKKTGGDWISPNLLLVVMPGKAEGKRLESFWFVFGFQHFPELGESPCGEKTTFYIKDKQINSINKHSDDYKRSAAMSV